MFYQHGFQAFISKPIDVMELDSVIKKWVRNESRGNAPIFEAPSVFDALSENGNDENIVIDIAGKK
jgi:hypothetical protein